jgi:hypothetical protein
MSNDAGIVDVMSDGTPTAVERKNLNVVDFTGMTLSRSKLLMSHLFRATEGMHSFLEEETSLEKL